MNSNILKTVGMVAVPALKTIGSGVVKSAKGKGAYVIVSSFFAIIGAILSAIFKEKLHKKFLKKHDKEMAERLYKECSARIEEMKKQCERDRVCDKHEIMIRIKRILREYGIDPSGLFDE